jgi:hypothetical protein
VEERNESGLTTPAAPAVPAAPVPPELEQAQAAFARGDFRETRRLATLTLAHPELGEEARREADRLLGATSHDPLAVYLGIGCLLFFAIIVYFTLVR